MWWHASGGCPITSSSSLASPAGLAPKGKLALAWQLALDVIQRLPDLCKGASHLPEVVCRQVIGRCSYCLHEKSGLPVWVPDGCQKHVSQQNKQRNAAPFAVLLTAGQQHPAAAPVLARPAPGWTACTRHRWQFSLGVQEYITACPGVGGMPAWQMPSPAWPPDSAAILGMLQERLQQILLVQHIPCSSTHVQPCLCNQCCTF